MKKCAQCGQTYSDPDINFCLNDGELLNYLPDDPPPTIISGDRPYSPFLDDSPTVMMDPSRITNQTNWQPSSPPVPWQGQKTNLQNQPYGVARFGPPKDQTLATISLALGIFACLFVCCYGGVWLGLPAAIVGFLAMRNVESDPNRYSGRGLAIGGMVLGIITFLASMVFLMIGVVAG